MAWSSWLLVALPVAAGGAAAQRDAASLTGIVTQRGLGTPIPSAYVYVVGGSASTMTDQSGRFRLNGLAAGTHVVRIQRVGYAPLEFEIDLADGETVDLRPGELLLDAAAITMDSVVVTASGEPLILALAMQGFYERRNMNSGSFLSRAEFTKWHPMSFTDALRRIPGVSITLNPNYHKPARPPRLGLFGTVPGRTKMIVDTRKTLITTRGCETIVIWVDGMVLGTTAEIDIDELVGMNTVEAIEVFRGPSELPARFAATRAACAALVIWTRAAREARAAK